MSKRIDKQNMMKTRHPSLELQDAEVVKKKHQDMLTKAKNKFLNISDALRVNKILNGDHDHQHKKSRTQATLDYFFKPCPNKNEKNHVFANSKTGHERSRRASSLQKQNSEGGGYPIKIEISGDEVLDNVSGLRASSVPKETREMFRETAALALERPRKKLSFREPEISGYATERVKRTARRTNNCPELKRSISAYNGLIRRGDSWEDLESQAMRVVRTVGQAFEVCHKLSINAPDPDPPDQDEQETLTQDLVSDHISDIVSDKPKKDLLSETTSDRNSLPPEEAILLEDLNNSDLRNLKVPHCDIIPPPSTNPSRRPHLASGETYISPLSDAFLTAGSGSGSMGNTTLFSTGSSLSAQHEIQLLKEQLDQQSQQTQAAVAQLQLVREQLAAEQGARMEAQARTHQLLVHNKELLDHIAALVSHLQGEKGSPPSHSGPHVAMPQHQQNQISGGSYVMDRSENTSMDQNPLFQPYNLQPQGLIENRMVTSCLPPSPLRTTYNPSGSVFNFAYPAPQDGCFENQLLQRLQALSGYTPPSYSYNYQPLLQPSIYNPPLINSNYNLQPPPQKKMQHSPLGVVPSYTGSPVLERRVSPARNTDYQFQQDQINQNQLQVNQNIPRLAPQSRSQAQAAPQAQAQAQGSPQPQRKEAQFIKPLSQLGTLTTTDVQGRVRVIVPVPSRSPDDDAGNLLASLRINDDFRPAITRSTSEKVPNRSELMSQVQRTAWARHTTK